MQALQLLLHFRKPPPQVLLALTQFIELGPDKEMPYRPNQTDHLLAHVLWDHPLDPKVMEPKPSVSYEWERLEDGSGQFIPHIFNEEEATASELRDLRDKMQEMKRSFRDCLLIAMKEWLGLTWQQRWQRWNQLFPDFAVQSPGALRQAYSYAQKNREQIQARYERLAQPSHSDQGSQ